MDPVVAERHLQELPGQALEGAEASRHGGLQLLPLPLLLLLPLLLSAKLGDHQGW